MRARERFRMKGERVLRNWIMKVHGRENEGERKY